MTVCRRSIPARSNPKVSISTSSSSTNRGRFSTAWGKISSSTPAKCRAPRSSAGSPPAATRWLHCRCFLPASSAAVFIRGLLQDEYEVDLSGVHWVQGATNSPDSHGNPSPPRLIKQVSIEQNASGRSLSELLESNDIQAIIGSGLPAALRTNPDVRRLFPDFHAVELDYYRRTRIFPIMHLVAMRRDVYERHPFIATSLFKAMNEAKELALAKMGNVGTLRYMLPGMIAELDEIDASFAGDPWPYGVEANRPTLEALVRYMAEQSLIEAPIPVDQLFVPIYGQ